MQRKKKDYAKQKGRLRYIVKMPSQPLGISEASLFRIILSCSEVAIYILIQIDHQMKVVSRIRAGGFLQLRDIPREA